MNENEKLILVVDDEESIRNSLRGILENEGYRVVTAENGKKALEKIQGIPFDAVLVDLKLPDIEGTDLILRLPKNHEITKIIIAGFQHRKKEQKPPTVSRRLSETRPTQRTLSTLKIRLAKL